MSFIDKSTLARSARIEGNLKTQSGKRLFAQPARTADVAIQSFRHGDFNLLTVGCSIISRELNPRNGCRQDVKPGLIAKEGRVDEHAS